MSKRVLNNIVSIVTIIPILYPQAYLAFTIVTTKEYL